MKRYIRSAGYHGYSMSNNAVEAYENGEKPLSKWTKSAILTELAELDAPVEVQNIAKTLSLDVLKDLFLYKSSWHHTSKMYNRTDFYSVNPDVPISEINNKLSNGTPATTSQEPTYSMAKVEWGEWEGSKRRPKLVTHSGYALIKDPWAYVFDDGQGVVKKKKTSGSHFDVIEYYSKVPAGAEQTFNTIKQAL